MRRRLVDRRRRSAIIMTKEFKGLKCSMERAPGEGKPRTSTIYPGVRDGVVFPSSQAMASGCKGKKDDGEHRVFSFNSLEFRRKAPFIICLILFSGVESLWKKTSAAIRAINSPAR